MNLHLTLCRNSPDGRHIWLDLGLGFDGRTQEWHCQACGAMILTSRS
jgi:hypothetical protein